MKTRASRGIGSSIRLAILDLLAVVLVPGLAFVSASPGETLPVLTPSPQQISWTGSDAAWLDADRLDGVTLPALDTPVSAALERLGAALGGPLPATSSGALRLVLAPLPSEYPDRTRHEGYRLTVDGKGVVVSAETAHGLHNGLVTLTALVDKERGLPCVTILDWPDQEVRAVYAGSLDEAESLLDRFVGLKLNMLVVEDARLYDLDDPEICGRVQRLAQRYRDNHFAFVPELQSLGWGLHVLEREPRAVEALWMERLPFAVVAGRVDAADPPLPRAVVDANLDFEAGFEGWQSDTYFGQWRPSAPEDASIEEANGKRVLRLSLNERGNVRVSRSVTVEPGGRYVLRASVKTESIQTSGGGAYIEVYGIDEGGAWTENLGRANAQRTKDTDWATIEAPFTAGGGQSFRPGAVFKEDDPDQQSGGYEQVSVILRLEDATGTAWFGDVEIEPAPSPNPLANAIVTEAAKVVVEDADGGFRYEEGRDYTLSVPEPQFPTGLGEAFEILLTEDSRIQDGDTVLVSFNQAQEGVITNCPSEPLYYAFMRKSITNVVEKLNPRYLHIGHDEPQFFNRCQRCRDRDMSNEDLFVDAIKRVRQIAKDADPDIRVMLWDDAINPYQNASHLGAATAAEKLPKDLIIAIWWYDDDQWEEQIDKSVAYFTELGFSVTGSPWFRKANAYHWTTVLDGLKDNPLALGVIYTSWAGVPEPWGALDLTAEHIWSFGEPSPEL